MIKIRKGVFETNSSSVHTLVLSKNGMEPNKMKVRKRKKEDGTFGKYIIGSLGSFDKDTRDYTTQEEKLSYLLTICYLTDGREDLDWMRESWEFCELENMIKEYCNVDGLLIDKKTEELAYIDHQSRYNYDSLSDFQMDYKEFIFNSYISLHTTCD